MKTFIFLLLTAISFQQVFSQSAADYNKESSPTLKVLSWNIYMLPRLVKRTGQLDRAPHIAEMLNASDYDVISFQEAFDKKTRNLLAEQLREEFPYQWGPAYPKGGFMKTNSGIWFVSKLPITFVDQMEFNDCAGIDCRGRKGAVLIEVEKDGITYQVMGTHLDSQPKERDALVRVKQYEQIYAEIVVGNEKPGVPQILCGDYNTRKREKQYYDIMLSKLDAKDGPYKGDVQLTYDGHNNDLIADGRWTEILDYVLVRENNVPFKEIVREVKVNQADWHKKGKKKDLSDHYAIEISLVPQAPAVSTTGVNAN